MEHYRLVVDTMDEGIRLDQYLADELEGISRSYVSKLIKEGNVLVGDRQGKPSLKLFGREIVDVCLPQPSEAEILPEDIPLDILFEDDDIIVVNKPKGMVVHPAAGHTTGTLVNALMYHCRNNLSGINGVLRPGIVHRIDMNTTGVLVACKNDFAHQSIAAQLSVHSITRRYQAICHNAFQDMDGGTVDAPIGRSPSDRKRMAVNPQGKPAVTHYSVIKNFEKFSHIQCELETGRTHQIRVHMASIGHPLLGDDVYHRGKCPFNLQGQTLHAGVLGFIHPRTNEYVEFTAPLPQYFLHLLEII